MQPFKNNFPTLFQAEITSRILDVVDEIDGRRVSTVGEMASLLQLAATGFEIQVRTMSYRVTDTALQGDFKWVDSRMMLI